MDILKTIENLKKNNMKPYFVETKEEALALVKDLLSSGESISHGGSETLKQIGAIDLFKSGDYYYIDRSGLEGEELRQAYIRAFGCDTYITSTNAITENGELYNVDGNSNRVACIVYGPKQVIVVAGVNKVVENINEAIKRVKEKSAPPNTKRLNCKTPCAVTGKCISLNDENSMICDGCQSEQRICCNYVVSAKQRHKDRIKVILVNEVLGY
jgi:hypothetical protein